MKKAKYIREAGNVNSNDEIGSLTTFFRANFIILNKISLNVKK